MVDKGRVTDIARDAFGVAGGLGSAPSSSPAWDKFIIESRHGAVEYNSFSGVDIRAAIWIPPSDDNLSGSYKVWSELQTVTISSERPAGPVRCLGVSSVRDYVRGVRTIAGSMIFTLLDRDVFADLYQKSTKESPSYHPTFVDMIPTFHLILSGVNEFGLAAGLVIADCTLTNMGQTFSVDDLMLEATYTYVAKYASPFVSPEGWRSVVNDVSRRVSGIMRAGDMARPDFGEDTPVWLGFGR